MAISNDWNVCAERFAGACPNVTENCTVRFWLLLLEERALAFMLQQLKYSVRVFKNIAVELLFFNVLTVMGITDS